MQNRVYNLKEFCIPLKFRIEYVVHVFTRRSKENEKNHNKTKRLAKRKKTKKNEVNKNQNKISIEESKLKQLVNISKHINFSEVSKRM